MCTFLVLCLIRELEENEDPDTKTIMSSSSTNKTGPFKMFLLDAGDALSASSDSDTVESDPQVPWAYRFVCLCITGRPQLYLCTMHPDVIALLWYSHGYVINLAMPNLLQRNRRKRTPLHVGRHFVRWRPRKNRQR